MHTLTFASTAVNARSCAQAEIDAFAIILQVKVDYSMYNLTTLALKLRLVDLSHSQPKFSPKLIRGRDGGLELGTKAYNATRFDHDGSAVITQSPEP